ncbi:MAG: asparagine synthase (glutamine-hydrolyzing) [Cyclobacteriaceae bacterium]|nr:asparagine synthase (glutamine-hydrolyzing) [Cyclobacteriaceae bacterium]
MCGITGIYSKNLVGKIHMINLSRATDMLARRGPDARGVWMNDTVGLGHRRLSIIDTSENGNQPMADSSGRYRIVFNGEIYNFRELRDDLLSKGITFRSSSDTEVLLYAYIHFGEKCLQKLNGFFAFAVYDEEENSLFLARDRFGIKPLYYLDDEDKFLFASDMHSMLAYGIEKKLDFETLYTYLQLNYTTAPHTMIRGINMLEPGHFLKVKNHQISNKPFYRIAYDANTVSRNTTSYDKQKQHLKELVEASVQRRMVADVPLGTFLSGGIDSSIISGIAKRYKDDLHTFSIGYRDEPFFDETSYANLVAKKFNTNHTVFSLTNDDLFEHLHKILDCIDQPFADSSAIPTWILSKKTREHVTVALSGDGADELFSGYNKHSAHLKAMGFGPFNQLLRTIAPALHYIPKSRNGALSNKIRQAEKYGLGLRYSQKERYWRWAGLASEERAFRLMHEKTRAELLRDEFIIRKQNLLNSIQSEDDFNELLLTDMQLVLPNDMLRKVDLMSMAHGLEVRVPFLDHHIVNYVFSLPVSSKINTSMRKRILQDTFRDLLPPELYNRPKKGFEVPLLRWFRTALKSMITDDLLSDRFIESQQIFDVSEIRRLKKQTFFHELPVMPTANVLGTDRIPMVVEKVLCLGGGGDQAPRPRGAPRDTRQFGFIP